MSYDLIVFDPSTAPRSRPEFMVWLDKQDELYEENPTDEPAQWTPALQAWFEEIRQIFPAMNGLFADPDADVDNPYQTDYCIGQKMISANFSWSCAQEAYETARRLAVKHGAGLFNISREDEEILFPDSTLGSSSTPPRPKALAKKKSWWKFW